MDALALVQAAESEPLLGHRTEPVTAAIAAAAAALDDAEPQLRARVMLRLAQLKMVELDLEGADAALAAAMRHAPKHRALMYLAGARSCRVAIRRGDRDEAASTLRSLGSQLPELAPDSDPIWQTVIIEAALGIAELAIDRAAPPFGGADREGSLAIDDDPAYDADLEPLRALLAPDAPPLSVDVRFTAHQLLATAALARGDLAATTHLRAVVAIARDARSPADEVEARLALAAVLVAAETHIAREEAARNVEQARALATEHQLGPLALAATLAQAGVRSHSGNTAGAIDLVLVLARAAAANDDLAGYVAAVGVMAELYARAGDVVSAFRTIAEARHALTTASGTDATPLFRDALGRLRDRVGEDRLEQIAADVARANTLATEILNKPR